MVGFVSGNIYSHYFEKDLNPSICNVDYIFISDSAGCSSPQVLEKRLYIDFVHDLENYIVEQKRLDNADHVSVYFRDLESGPTFGIYEKENFAPASLLKLPLLISYLSLAENDEGLLDKKILYEGKPDILEQTSTISSKLSEGKEYTIRELLEKMIEESDNLAYLLLFNAIAGLTLDGDQLEQTMIDMGLVSPRRPTEDTITVKSYASLFRQLYNASYLSPKMSEYALEILSKSTYNTGIAGGVPNKVNVANKFGERSGFDSSLDQLHDCGIIYYPNNPYLLCIMTRGSNYEKLESIISEISKKVYEEVDSRKIQI
jgi:beta-lactamase class A